MTHEEQECLKLGKHILRMIRDVLSTPAKDEAIGSQLVTTRDGGKIYLVVCKEAQTISDLEAVVAKRMDMVHVHMKSPGEPQ